ncbi:RNA polymerase sigma factor [Bacillus horti]|uniref:RNA polymerase sigma factor n=1 Tax=Caldalkalibacillus horti TaxID=77523 RepID=A0ABT9W3L6_9BACI|nr:sigma-70 family RNA polymerase sigma factor [Bacillus horti]MDQ0167821.1 RNA polymerase sigma factor (sigma-70 family) [Bacillus horti]
MIEDRELIHKIQQGEAHLFNEIIIKYQKLVYFSIIKMLHGQRSEAEDLTQEVFLSAYRSIHRFREESALSTWLMRIATNKTIDYKRKRQLYLVPDEGVIDQIPLENHDPLKEIVEQESSLYMEQLINQLPETYRLVIQQYYYEHLSYKEIASLENVEVKTVESRLYRARNRLRSLWKEEQKHEM